MPPRPAGDNLVNDLLHSVSELLPLYTTPSEHVQQEEKMVTNLAQETYHRSIHILKEAEAPARYNALVCAVVLVHHVPMQDS